MKRTAEDWRKEFYELYGEIDPPSADDVQAFAERVAAQARREALGEHMDELAREILQHPDSEMGDGLSRALCLAEKRRDADKEGT